jgi:drug/metabolite transporter, DME family
MKLNSTQTGFVQIILSGMCFGALGFFGKLAYQQGILPGELLALRYSLSALLTGAIILFTKPRSFIMKPFHFGSSLLLGVFGYALFSSLFFMALTGLSASLTVLLLYTYPAMVAIMSQFILKERLNRLGIYSLIIASIGMIGLVWGEWSISEPRFLLYGVGAAFFYALYIMYSRKYLSGIEALPSSFYVQLGAGICLWLIHFQSAERPVFILTNNTLLIFSMAIICSLFAMTLFLAGLRRISSSEASILSTTEPLFGVLIATLFLKETLAPIQVVGGILILIAMILIAKSKSTEQG